MGIIGVKVSIMPVSLQEYLSMSENIKEQETAEEGVGSG